MLDFQAARWLLKGEVAKQAGNNHPTSIPTGVFKTSDGHINIAATGTADLGALLQGDGRAEALLERSRLSRPARRRSKNRDELNAEIDDLHRARTRARTGSSVFNKAGVPCGPIYTIDQVFADPQVKHLGIAQARRRPGQARRSRWSASRSSLSRTPQQASWRGRRSSASTPTRC